MVVLKIYTGDKRPYIGANTILNNEYPVMICSCELNNCKYFIIEEKTESSIFLFFW